jgi:hypothetical protein
MFFFHQHMEHNYCMTWLFSEIKIMDPNSLEAGLESLCLDEELSRVVATRLGAIPKTMSAVGKELPPPSPSPLPTRLEPPTTPAVLRRQQKKKNRKDRRRYNEGDDTGRWIYPKTKL